MKRAINLIVIHCAATPSGKPLTGTNPATGDTLDAAWVINTWHAQRGFKRAATAVAAYNSRLPSIGYHWVIDLDGALLPGRALQEVPAQAAGFNANAVGICLVGGMEREGRYTTAQWATLRTLVTSLADTLNVPLAPPTRSKSGDLANHPTGYTVVGGVCGHRDLSPDKNGNGLIEPFEWLKTCPGFDVATWLARDMVPEARHVIEGGA